MKDMTEKNHVAVFKTEAPGVSAAFDGVIEAICALDGLDAKTRQLVYIGIKASQGDDKAVVAHVPMAKAAGARREEIRDAVLITLTVCGVRGVFNCLPAALEMYDACK
jgi:alkylhydroperoxidase/carboxymuconolactone decarboxylase family protein YurZ